MELLDGSQAQNKPNEQILPAAGDTVAADVTAQTEENDVNDAQEATVAEVTAQTQENEVTDAPAHTDKDAVLENLRLIADADPITDEQFVTADRLKRAYYTLDHEQQELAFKQYVEAGGVREEYVAPIDQREDLLKQLLSIIKDKKAEARRRAEAQLLANKERKEAIIAEFEVMSADTDNVNRHWSRAKELQSEFKAIGEVPQENSTEIWKKFTAAVERFYDQWKINKELRDYDFKKNLAEKQLIIAEVKGLADEEDVITAHTRVNELFQKWREIGPVAKEMRDEIWNEFSDARAVVSKRYQAFFEERKARERENEEAKKAICERVEAIDFSEAKTFSTWNELTQQIVSAQNDWKKLGQASRKVNNQLYSRFRETCDRFFAAKAEYFKSVKDVLSENLAHKTALCEKAEALKESTDWRATTQALLDLQKEWKTIGAVPKKHSDAVWRRFMDACDYFFDQKKKQTSAVRKTENANLRTKREIIEQLTALNAPDCTTPRDEAIATVKQLRQTWQSTGHVPFKEKDALADTYRKVVGELFDKYDIHETRARMESFEKVVRESTDDNKLMRDRERLMRSLESRRQELKTYENNLGFFNSRSKSGEQMLQEMQRKMQHIKDDITDLEKKISIIDAKI